MNWPVILGTVISVLLLAVASLGCLACGALLLVVLWPVPVFLVFFAAVGHEGNWLLGGAAWMLAHTQGMVFVMESQLCRWAYYPEDYPRAQHLAARGAMWALYALWWVALAMIVWHGRTWLR